MSHDEFERLSGSVFDAGDEARDRERIAALLDREPALRERWEDLMAARAGLAGAGMERVPDDLHLALVDAARAAAPAPAARGTWLAFVTAAIQARPAYALGGAVAAGFAIGAIGIALLTGAPRGLESLAPGTAATLAPVAPAVATTPIEWGGARIDVTARRAGGRMVVRLGARDAAATTLTLAWDPAELRLGAVRWEGAEAPAFDPSQGRAVMHMPGASGSELTFEESGPRGGALSVTLRAAGGDRVVTIPPPGEERPGGGITR